MAKRIFELAKELGVKSKAIREKCIAEGIPEDKVKNHMASISPGLEASIREWFTASNDEGGAATATAVQTSAQVDLTKVRAAPRRAKAVAKPLKKDADAEAAPESENGAETAVPEAKPAAKAKPVVKAKTATKTAPAVEPASPIKVPPPAVVAPPAAPAPDEPEAPAADVEPEEVLPAATAPAAEAPPKDAPSDDGGDAPKPSKQAPKKNVPDRPKVVTPAGPQLESRSPVRLSGPKVVRVEAPEPVDSPKPRRDHGGRGGGGPSRGGGAMPPDLPMPGKDESDRGRSPRRKRPAATPGGGGAGARNTGRGRGRNQEGLGTGIFREQDLLEREARLERSAGFMKQRRREQRARRGAGGERPPTMAETGGSIKIAAPFTIKDLSSATGIKAGDIVKKLFQQGVMATINSVIETEKAEEVMIEYGIELEVAEAKTAEEQVSEEFEKLERLDVGSRSPVVTILGHVDHGKTSLLDKIRNADVAAGEAGGITQATSAFRVPVTIGDDTKHVVFLDTPGHQAFTEMRARGANMTDIVILVVAADDGVMPQTIESIAHAKAAEVPIIVALNKCDRPEATDSKIQEIYGQLAEHELNPVAWGGDIEVVKTSAATGDGIEDLLEVIDLQGQLLELKAGYAGPARGTVIEAQMLPGRGATANLLVQDGELKVGDFIVVGRAYGRVRDIIDDRSQQQREVGPSQPVQISGLDEVPTAGDRFFIVDSLKKAQDAAEHRRGRERVAELSQPKVTLDSMLSQMSEGDVKHLRIVLKADVQGSVDVLRNEIEKISTDEVKVRVLHSAVGGINETDVTLAQASGAVIIGFNVIATGSTRSIAEQKSVEIRTYQVIYHLTDDLKKAAEGLLEPELRQEILGHADVRAVFKISKVGAVAGCYVTDGTVERDALIRVTRDGVVIENDRTLEQLKRVKDDVKEVRSGTECGMKIAGYDDIKEGDVLECYKNVEVRRSL